jgi:hypothetical protein
MILEEIIGEAKFSVTRNGKSVALAVGDSFTDEEFLTRTVYGDSGKAVIRVDANCTVEIGASPAPTPVGTAPTIKSATPTTAKLVPTPVVKTPEAE